MKHMLPSTKVQLIQFAQTEIYHEYLTAFGTCCDDDISLQRSFAKLFTSKRFRPTIQPEHISHPPHQNLIKNIYILSYSSIRIYLKCVKNVRRTCRRVVGEHIITSLAHRSMRSGDRPDGSRFSIYFQIRFV